MGPFDGTLLELLAEVRQRDLRNEYGRLHPTTVAARSRRSGLKGAVASTLVRWGLRLDPAAGERLRPLDLAPAAREGRRS